jgi:hypothetical protein
VLAECGSLADLIFVQHKNLHWLGESSILQVVLAHASVLKRLPQSPQFGWLCSYFNRGTSVPRKSKFSLSFRRRLQLEQLELRNLLATHLFPAATAEVTVITSPTGGSPPLVGVDFDWGDQQPENWTWQNSGAGPHLLENLQNETGATTSIDLHVDQSLNRRSFVNFSGSQIPTHDPALNTINAFLTAPNGTNANWRGLEPLTQHDVYVFFYDFIGEFDEYNVTLSGDGTPVVFNVAKSDGQLWINDQRGTSAQTLESYAKQVVSDQNGEINISFEIVRGVLGIAGLAIAPPSSPASATLDLAGEIAISDPLNPAGDATDDDNNSLDEVPIEMVSMSLTGDASVALSATNPSVGILEERTDVSTGTLDVQPFDDSGQLADSFFDVFVEISIGGEDFVPASLLRLSASSDQWPPAETTTYQLVDPVALLTPLGQETPHTITDVTLTPGILQTDAIPPTVISVELNKDQVDPDDLPGMGVQPTSWQQQRSRIASFTVTFSESVDVSLQDLRLTNQGINAPQDEDQVIDLSSAQLGLSDEVLTLGVANLQLPDGAYQLEILSSAMDQAGNLLDGDGNGTGGDPYVVEGNSTNKIFQLLAEWSGDIGVSVFYFTTFSYWFGFSFPISPLYADLNGDDGVSVFDFTGFAQNFGKTITFNSAFAPVRGQLETARLQPHVDEFEQQLDRQMLADRALGQWEMQRPNRRFEFHANGEQDSPRAGLDLDDRVVEDILFIEEILLQHRSPFGV